MADNDVTKDDIYTAAEYVANSIDNAADTSKASIQGVTQALNKEGVQLTALQEQVSEDLSNMGDYFRDIVSYLVSINNTILSIQAQKNTNQVALQEKEPQKESEQASPIKEKTTTPVNFDTSANTAQAIGTATSLANITGTGFSVLANILTDLSGNVLNRFDQLTQAFIGARMPIIQSQTTRPQNQQPGNQDQTQIATNNALAIFFTQLAGPLNTIASGILLLTVATTLLGTIGVNPELLAGIVFFGAMLFTTFSVLRRITILYQETMMSVMDPETSSSPGNILYIVNALTQLMITINAAVLLSVTTISIVQVNMAQLCMGLLVTFGTVFVSILALSALSAIAAPELEEEAPFTQLINGFIRIVITLSAVSLVMGIAWPIISTGMVYMMAMVSLTELALGGLVIMARKLSTVPAAVLDTFQSILTTLIITIGVLSILTIVLGIIPITIIQQGILTVTLLTGLTMVLMGMTTFGIKSIQKTPADQIYAFMGVLIASIACITILSVLTIILAQQDMTAVLMAIGCLVVISAIPMVLFKLMANIGQQTGALAQALLGTVVSAAITTAVAGVATLIIGLLSAFTMEQVLTTVAAVGLMAVLMIAMSGFIILMGAITPTMMALSPMAFIGTGIATVMALALSVAALGITMALSTVDLNAVLIAVRAVTLTAISFVIIATSITLLGGMTFALLPMAALATISIGIIAGFSLVLTEAIASISTVLSNVAMDPLAFQILGTVVRSMIAVATSMAPLAILAPIVLVTSVGALITIGAATVLALALSESMAQISATTVPEGSETTLQSLQQSVGYLAGFARAINNLPAINPIRVISAYAILKTAKSIESKLSTLGSEEKVQKIQYLTNSLAQLGAQQQSLNGLAAAISNVAQATASLQQVQAANTVAMNRGVERMTGGSGEVQNIYQTKSTTTVQNNSSTQLNDVKDTLREMVSLLRDIKEASWENADQVQQTNMSLNSSAMMQESLADI